MILVKFIGSIRLHKIVIGSIFFLFLCNYGIVKAKEDLMILDDLSNPGVTLQNQNWAFFTDGVMGGLSQGKAIVSNIGGVDCYHMTGNVTT